MSIATITLVKIFIPAAMAFGAGILMTPFFTHYFYKYRMWKKNPRGTGEPVSAAFKKVHNEKGELSTPRVGGILVWFSVLVVVSGLALVAWIFPSDTTEKLNFLSRGQTFIPLFALVAAALVGLSDDLLQIYGKGAYAVDAVVYRKVKASVIILIGFIIAWWFVAKLGVTHIYFPFYGDIELGLWFVPIFIFVMFATFSTSVIDGIDGLAAGVLAPIFIGYAAIAFFNNQIDLAALASAISGALLAFLWFNIPPARFYLGETGILGLTVTLSVFAFMTDTVFLLPIIAFPLVVTSASSSIQMLSKRYRNGKKVFLVAPLHHHFEALGWPSYKVVMRYWVISMISVIIGVVLVTLGK